MRSAVHRIQSSSAEASLLPTVAFVPGGPGLSSRTLRSLEILKRSHNLAFIDPIGTGSADRSSVKYTFQSTVESIVEGIKSISGPVVLCGHSFGGLYVAEAASSGTLDLQGLVFMGSPLSPKSYQACVEVYENSKTSEMLAAQTHFDKELSDHSFKLWLSSYQKLYFTSQYLSDGARLMLEDSSSAKAFLEISAEDIPVKENYSKRLARVTTRKLVIAGTSDLLFPPDLLSHDAVEAHCAFRSVSGGHFMTFEQPDSVARLIEDLLSDRLT